MPSQPDESAALAIQTPAINDRSLAAGLAYAMGSRVSGMSFDAATGLMLGKVRGGADVPYSTTAKLVRKTGGWSCTVGVCSCPVRKDCKHVAALLFAAEDNPAIRVQLLAPAEVSRLSRQPASLDLADWEQALSPLISQPGITQSISGIPLALQFEIEDPAPHFSYTGRRDPLRSVRQLKARPVIMGAKGKWIRGDVSWNTLSYLNFRRECNEAHIEWMQAFLAAHTAAANRVHNSSALWLGLNTFAGKNMWSLLADARKIGLALVHSRGTEPVRLAESPAAVGLNLSRYGHEPAVGQSQNEAADDGGLELAPTITVEGEAVDPASVGTIGRPAHGVFLTTGGEALPGVSAENVITLAALENGLSEELLTFVTAGSTLHIPAKDETRFLTGFYPKLKQAARVTATDESVALPALALPTLSLLANYGADHRVRLHWEWHYKSGNLVTAQPLWRHPGDHGYRDDTAEARILEGIGQPWNVVPALGESASGGWGTPRLSASAELSGLDTLAFTEDVLPELRNTPDVSVDTAGNIADYREAEEAPVVSISTKATEQRDWFDLGIQISLEGQPVSFAAVFSALAAGQTKMLLPSGAYFSLDLPELHQLRALIEEARSLQDNKDAPLQISRFQAGLWDELAQLGIVDEQATAWREAVGGLLEGGINGLPLPPSLNAELRPYQLEGFNWLSFLYRHSLGGILADDMGLGKTVQALALMCAAKEQAASVSERADSVSGAADSVGAPSSAPDGGTPFLVVAPTSVVGNWAAEAARFAPGLTVRIVSETFAKNSQDAAVELAGADIVITSYALFRIDYDSYASKTWAGLVLDEAQFVKNHQSKAYQCARKLPAAFKLAITGTPLENNLMEFWALTSIVAPGLFSSPKRFAEYYQKPVEKNGDKGQLDKLRRRVRPLMMRRTKDQVIQDLPPKQEQILEVVLNPRHQKVYQTHLQRERQKILGLIEDVNKNRFTIFQSLTLLRQLSLDASLVDPSLSGVRSSKLDVLFEQLEDLVAEGHRALIFSQFTGFLGKVRERLVEEKIEFCYLDGGTRNRTDVVNEFKNGSAPVFLISLKAGGFGLNLTEADYVFLLDPWWNPASEAQAVDRTHRIGQARNVMVYRLVAKDTIEEKVMALKARKSQLFADVMEGDALSSGSITAEDLAGLFKD
ncbi:DEAD/DEAH box helicase [Pseudarthrobacter sp. AL07]|uniref:DEAD/DEAH box helicase n=1 Tax=unclassified Pseudarthrobacter TaxID=2647000 RepID=UPI00249CE708|nr:MULTISPECIES: DEAD/DEAH box helicase [unclassified Pseudarthrobacter]MDI3194774.1 DEAD/DEAH box helicase [Pseudarthrobacter sp. AL20]MDI3208782.1 DEAD/DEAH box helicase [Pseudarthrobacter sp. AL07]